MSLSPAQAWELTRRISPHYRVRLASRDIDGSIVNSYPRTISVRQPVPDTPWAMPLADENRQYRFLCFDLDAGKGQSARDAVRLAKWLDELDIAYVTTISGPSGGRHVWIALSESVEADTVTHLALLARQVLPSLDITPLTNPATGCVRPPGAPHRDGGSSRIIAGHPTVLEYPSATFSDVENLIVFLIDAGAVDEVHQPTGTFGPAVSADGRGNPYLSGPRRSVSPRIAHLLDSEPGPDMSVTMNTVLTGLAFARWRFADVEALLPSCPALEHARSQNTGSRRIRRTDRQALARLRRGWADAVSFVAQNQLTDVVGDDEGFLRRVEGTVRAVEALQVRAAASPGRWGEDSGSTAARRRRGRPSERAVLDAVCLYALQSARTEVEADGRRLALDTGYGREACRLALLSLVVDGWLEHAGEAQRPHGARYRLSTAVGDLDWAQATTRPRPGETPLLDVRSRLIGELERKLASANHDVFAAPGSLGRSCGRVLALFNPGTVASTADLVTSSRIPAARLRRSLRRLHWYGFVSRFDGGWVRDGRELRDYVAAQLGVAGYLSARARRYGEERQVWAWWQAECIWMSRPGKRRRRRGSPSGVALFAVSDRPEFQAYPRGPDRRCDHRQARALVRIGALSSAS